MVEFKIDLSDAVFQGSEESVDKIVSTYQMRLNLSNFEGDAYQACLDNTFLYCSRYILTEYKAIDIMNDWIRNTKDRDLEYELQEHVDKLESDDSSDQEKTVLLHEFYTRFTADGVQGLDKIAKDH